jgi:hypothetical protein
MPSISVDAFMITGIVGSYVLAREPIIKMEQVLP